MSNLEHRTVRERTEQLSRDVGWLRGKLEKADQEMICPDLKDAILMFLEGVSYELDTFATVHRKTERAIDQHNSDDANKTSYERN